MGIDVLHLPGRDLPITVSYTIRRRFTVAIRVATMSPAQRRRIAYAGHLPTLPGFTTLYKTGIYESGRKETVVGKLIYSMITSLDGYVADEEGNFDWAVPDDEFHTFINDHFRDVGTFIYGRRMYETMVYWETALDQPQPEHIAEWARLWQDADKIVISGSLTEPQSKRTRIERSLDAEMVRALKRDTDRDITIDGPHIASHAIRSGLIDEMQVFIVPVIVGGGNRFYPNGVRLNLELLENRRFTNGTVYLQYAVKPLV